MYMYIVHVCERITYLYVHDRCYNAHTLLHTANIARQTSTG